MNISIRLQLTVFISIMAFGALLILPSTSQAASSCQFTRDLKLGVTAPEVKCLQQYLNANGFIVSDTGAGSTGKETDEYKVLTEAAVVSWQKANDVSPTSGYFGSKSRAKYDQLISGSGPIKQVLGASTSTDSATGSSFNLQAQVDALMSQLAGGVKSIIAENPITPTVTTVKTILDVLKNTLDAIDNAEEAIDDNLKSRNIDDATDSIRDARADLYNGLRAMIAGDSVKAKSFFSDAAANADDAKDIVSKKASSNLINRLEDLRDDLDDAQDDIDAADDDGEDVADAQDYLDDADDYLDDAEDALDDKDEVKAKKYLDRAEGSIEDALDEL